ncbi:MAG TPA: DUF2782 domain-containing protein [Usitatibacter sp.]|nr:DUF2782 domain-containing protein [Usitatibacter sp.]
MRTLTAAALLAFALNAAAQSAPRPPPPGSVPLADPPKPPPMTEADKKAPEPVVTIRHDGDNEVSEYRINGKLYMQRVTPKHGKPYVLMDMHGDGVFTKQDETLTPNIRVPQWVLYSF